jgi:hypothetical protein
MAVWGLSFPKGPIFLIMLSVHRVNLLANATSAALLSGLLWQPKEPSAEPQQSLPRVRSQICNPTTRALTFDDKLAWQRKVEELAGRGITIRALLEFWSSLMSSDIMPSFDPKRSTTNDVARQAIIPMSRREGGGGQALASLWSKGRQLQPQVMVSHCWSGLFLHLVAGIVADILGEDYYNAVARRLLAGQQGQQSLWDAVAAKGALDTTCWICAFSVNQHASICNGFGPCPESGPERQEWEMKRRCSVTHKLLPLCNCGEPKVFSDRPAVCEMNKFDDMMRLLADQVVGFSHLVVVDAAFEVFQRAWCVAEIVESDLSGIPCRVIVKSSDLLDRHYAGLKKLDVRDCKASRVEDKDMILSNIYNVDAFNMELQWVIFRTRGLLSKWVDGQERAALIGRITRRARGKLPRSISMYSP